MTLTLATDDRGVARLMLVRPVRHNALTGELCDALAAAAAGIDADAGVRAVVLAGEGPSFCAGGDLGWMREQLASPRATRIREARRLADMLQALNTLGKPLIGRVQGAALGGGVGLMAVCDTVVAAEDARFGLTEARLGLIPATIAPYVVARIGEGRARDLFVTARGFGAAEARAMGLVTTTAAPEALDAALERVLAQVLTTAPAAAAAAKRLARSLGPRIDAEVIEATVERLADIWETPEAQAGIAAFLDKRPMPWVG